MKSYNITNVTTNKKADSSVKLDRFPSSFTSKLDRRLLMIQTSLVGEVLLAFPSLSKEERRRLEWLIPCSSNSPHLQGTIFVMLNSTPCLPEGH